MRIHGYVVVVVVALAVIAGTRAASAQYNVPSQASGESGRIQIAADEPSADSSMPKPDLPLGWELGASLDFMTSDPSLGDRKLKFTDVVLFRAHGLLAIGRRAEVFTGVDLLPKQPSYTDELVWQSALVGARYRFSDAWAAYARGQGGPGLGRDGYWVVGEAAAQYRLDLAEKTLFWENALGGTYTELFRDEPVDRRFWQAELLAQSGIAVREKKGIFATWLAFTFQFPLVARPTPRSPDPASGRALDPQTRVGVAFGMVLGVSRSVDLFLELSVLDRGDLDDPRTTLPILGGGFDQNRIVFGFNRRFGARRRAR
jgi:hypothetical protein